MCPETGESGRGMWSPKGGFAWNWKGLNEITFGPGRF